MLCIGSCKVDEKKGKNQQYMILKNILLVVKNIERSKEFYQKLFGLTVMNDFGEKVIFSGGLVLQEQNIWEQVIGAETISGGNNSELYFETSDMDTFLEKLKNSEFEIHYVNELTEYPKDRRVVRILDLDCHIIEIGEAWNIRG